MQTDNCRCAVRIDKIKKKFKYYARVKKIVTIQKARCAEKKLQGADDDEGYQNGLGRSRSRAGARQEQTRSRLGVGQEQGRGRSRVGAGQEQS